MNEAKSALDALEYIMDNAIHFLITIPIGYNKILDDWVNNNRKKITILQRCLNNCWHELSDDAPLYYEFYNGWYADELAIIVRLLQTNRRRLYKMRKVIVYGLGKNFYFGYKYIKDAFDVIAYSDKSESSRNMWKKSALYDGIDIIENSKIRNYPSEVPILMTIVNKAVLNEAVNRLKKIDNNREIIVMQEIHVGRFLVDPLFFKPNLSYDEKRLLFADNVEHITIEVNERCNRKCWFCPNSILERSTSNRLMEESLFFKIIKELQEIDFSGVVTYSFYNEPLLDKNITKKIRYIKKALPKSKQLVTTNGDYLNKEMFKSLAEAGLDYVIVSVYGKNDSNIDWDLNQAINENMRIIERCKLEIVWDRVLDFVVEHYAVSHGVQVRLQNFDFKVAGHNRGEILPSELPLRKIETRHDFCANPFVTLNVFYNGIVTVCGNMRFDYPDHKEFMIGDLNKSSIYDVFASEKATQFRQNFTNDINISPCSSCSRNGGLFDTFIPVYPGVELLDRPRYQKIKNESIFYKL